MCSRVKLLEIKWADMKRLQRESPYCGIPTYYSFGPDGEPVFWPPMEERDAD